MTHPRCVNSARTRLRRRIVVHLGLILALCASGWPRRTFAHETDQYSVPDGRTFADLEGYLSDYFRGALSKAITKINSPILGQHLLFLLSESDRVAWHVLWQFPPDLIFVERFEKQLNSDEMRQRFHEKLVLYRPQRWIYHHWALMLDPTKLVRLKRCSTIMADGKYFGTDKIAHFVHLGYLYYRAYRNAVTWGADEKSAVRKAVSVGTGGNPVTSERTLFGIAATGVFSNADLAANYVGFKFFRNLTEPVLLAGKEQPPILVRDGRKWRLNDHVENNKHWFTVYISDHWNEALNPSDYIAPTATFVREEVLKRCSSVVRWYSRRGDLQTREDFALLAATLETYFGEDYGHAPTGKDRITIAGLCFETPAHKSGPDPTIKGRNGGLATGN